MKKAILWMAALSMVALQSCRQDDVIDAGNVVDAGKFGSKGNKITWTLYDDGTLVIEGQGDWDYDDIPWYEYKEDIRAVVMKDGVTSIGESAFSFCSSLSSIILPESVTSIGGSAFSFCSSLSSITFPEGLTSIGEWAFYGCTSLTSITFPEGLTSIGAVAFSGCTSLTTIMIKAPIPPDIDGTNFGGVNESIPVYVPASSINAYRNSEWGRIFSNIQPM